jgi:hypothetical protein
VPSKSKHHPVEPPRSEMRREFDATELEEIGNGKGLRKR